MPSALQKSGSGSQTTYLLVEGNHSTGGTSDDQSVHDEYARKLAQKKSAPMAEALRAPLLVPAFPLPAKYNTSGAVGDVNDLYTQALDRATLVTQITDLKRLDLQLIAMIDDAIERLSSQSINVDRKILITGFSSSGMFANRFAILHPDRVQAAAIGNPGGWPMVPVGEWKGAMLKYPVGVSDLKELVGKEFDIQTFKSVPLYFYLGDQDTNECIYVNPQWYTQFGNTPVARFPVAERIYNSVGSSSQFVLYPGVGHEVTSAMMGDIITFFSNHLESP